MESYSLKIVLDLHGPGKSARMLKIFSIPFVPSNGLLFDYGSLLEIKFLTWSDKEQLFSVREDRTLGTEDIWSAFVDSYRKDGWEEVGKTVDL